MIEIYSIFSLMYFYAFVKSFQYFRIARQNKNFAFANFFLLVSISALFAASSSIWTFFYPTVAASAHSFLWVLVHLLFFGVLFVAPSLYESVKSFKFRGVRYPEKHKETDSDGNVVTLVPSKANKSNGTVGNGAFR